MLADVLYLPLRLVVFASFKKGGAEIMSMYSERMLEDQLVDQLETMGYQLICVKNEDDLLNNLRTQLEKFNGTSFSVPEFKSILQYLSFPSKSYEKSKALRDQFPLRRDDGSIRYIRFIGCSKNSTSFQGNIGDASWCNNVYQVTRQVTITGKETRRYDVTILINGLPLIQIELKRPGISLSSAFDQVVAYKRGSYDDKFLLFEYIQLFVISNGSSTKYYANNDKLAFEQTFSWSDKDNAILTDLYHFASVFLEPCHISEIICRHIVLVESAKKLMVLRPYQYYAVRGIVDLVEKHSVRNKDYYKPSVDQDNGYIWHTTGSGKTLTSFKAAQIVSQIKDVHKVVFVVDRKDLDYQTMTEFNGFEEGSVDGTEHTGSLIERLKDRSNKLVVTTIQKLDRAVGMLHYSKHINELKSSKIVFIFDECHRSQFGKTHQRIKSFFDNNQMIGFTGTPIFEENAVTSRVKDSSGKMVDSPNQTTESLFGRCLHRYVINDAIADKNVLGFSVEYVGRAIADKGSTRNQIDISVAPMNIPHQTKEELESPSRIRAIASYIAQHHHDKTQYGAYTAIFAVSNIDMVIKYYNALKALKEDGEHNLKVATIFSYSASEAEADSKGESDATATLNDGDSPPDPVSDSGIDEENRTNLDEFIDDYNKMFKTSFSTGGNRGFDAYRVDISSKVKSREIDILLVANMFLTGFDSKTLNTIYVDKNLKYHGLIQAFSRTNRIEKPNKAHGNVVVFRNLKDDVDAAIKLFARENARSGIDAILAPPYQEAWDTFKKEFAKLLALTPTVASASTLERNSEKLEFVRQFKNVMRAKSIASSYADFNDDFESDGSTAQEFAGFSDVCMGIKEESKKIYDKVLSDPEISKLLTADDETLSQEEMTRKAEAQEKRALAEEDYELELLHHDHIDVDYILGLLQKHADSAAERDEATHEQELERIYLEIDQTPSLRPKRDLIKEFVKVKSSEVAGVDNIRSIYDNFVSEQREKDLNNLASDNNLDAVKLGRMLDEYCYSGKKPLNIDVAGLLKTPLPFMKRTNLVKRLQIDLSSLKEKYS